MDIDEVRFYYMMYARHWNQEISMIISDDNDVYTASRNCGRYLTSYIPILGLRYYIV